MILRCGNPLINIMTEIWDAGAFQWRCRAWLSASYKIRRDLIMTQSTNAATTLCRRDTPAHISPTSYLQSTHQHHDRDMRRSCIWMTLSRSPRQSKPCRGYEAVQIPWILDQIVTLDPSLLQPTHRHHDRDVKHMCIRMTLSPTVFWISSNGSCTDNGPWSESSFSQNQIRVSLHIVASSNQPIIGSRGKCGLCVPVNRIISMYVCMYVCMCVCKSLLVSMILHSLAGTVEIVDWREQGQDCSHRERGQSSFDVSLAWWKGCHRNHVQGDQGALGIPLRQMRSCWQRFCIFVQPRW